MSVQGVIQTPLHFATSDRTLKDVAMSTLGNQKSSSMDALEVDPGARALLDRQAAEDRISGNTYQTRIQGVVLEIDPKIRKGFGC